MPGTPGLPLRCCGSGLGFADGSSLASWGSQPEGHLHATRYATSTADLAAWIVGSLWFWCSVLQVLRPQTHNAAVPMSPGHHEADLTEWCYNKTCSA